MGMRRGSAHGLGAHTWRLLISALAVALLVALGATSASAAKSATCSVTNKDTGRTFPRLQQAVDAARPSARLVVMGTCHGKTVIHGDVVIEGVRTGRLGRPALDGDGRERVLVIAPGVNVAIRDLAIQDGRARAVKIGGGITNRGDLTLRDVVVRRNRTSLAEGPMDGPEYVPDLGGGIYNTGSLSLSGSTKVAGNTSTLGGGIYNSGTLLMTDSSSIRGNLQHRDISVLGWGYGLYNIGTLIMRGSSNITRNLGGGYWNPGFGVRNTGSMTLEDSSTVRGNSGGVSNAGGSLTMSGSSTIRDNHLGCPPTGSGCIIWLQNPPHPAGLDSHGGTLVGVTCAPQTYANVYGNTPDDCYLEP